MPKRGIEHGRYAGMNPPHRAGTSYMPLTDQNRTTKNGLANRIFFVPIFVPNTGQYDGLNCNVQTAGGGGTNLRLGIYADDDGNPGPLLNDSGNIAADATGVKTSTFSPALILQGPRWYWLCVHTEDAVVVLWANQGNQAIRAGTTWHTVMLYDNQIFGALPDPAVVEGELNNQDCPNLYLDRV